MLFINLMAQFKQIFSIIGCHRDLRIGRYRKTFSIRLLIPATFSVMFAFNSRIWRGFCLECRFSHTIEGKLAQICRKEDVAVKGNQYR